MQFLIQSAAFEQNRGNFYKSISGSELVLEGPVLSSAVLPPPVVVLFIAVIQSSDTSDTAPCENLGAGAGGIMEGSRGGRRNSSFISCNGLKCKKYPRDANKEPSKGDVVLI